jgi:hypothetical protein
MFIRNESEADDSSTLANHCDGNSVIGVNIEGLVILCQKFVDELDVN